MVPPADAAEAQAKIKSEIPGKGKEYEKKGEAMASRAGQKLDSAVRLTLAALLFDANGSDTRSMMRVANFRRLR